MTRRITLVALVAIWLPTTASADSGTIRYTSQRLTIFTSPTPLRTGLVDVSVLLQNFDVSITVVAYPVAEPDRRLFAFAMAEAATNKLLRAAELKLPVSGTWRFEVTVGTETPVVFDADVVDGPPPWLDLALWIAWPVAAISLFAIHQWLVQRRGRSI